MVSHKRSTTVACTVIGAVFTLAIVRPPAFGQAAAKTFYPDDPLLREPAPRPVKKFAKRDVNDLYDFLENSFVTPRREGKAARQGPHPARDMNMLGDVPDSAWYTNRHYYHRMSIEELQRGPGNSTPPSPEGKWRIISAKTNGMTPGFVIEDEHKHRYVLKLDPPQYPELASAADVIGSKAFYALGYNTPENYIVHFRREKLEIGSGVKWHDASGNKHPLTGRMLDEMFRPQPRGADGTLRAMASRFIAGNLAGPFSYNGTRSDDPNDTIPHEDRRALRGLKVFAAWLNHHDAKAINSMDSLVTENGIPHLKHYLLDFGDILGSDGIQPKYAWSGNEYTMEGKSTLVGMLTFGFYVPRWDRAHYPDFTGVGRLDSWSFDPIAWKPNYPNPAFVLMDREDAFWAAKQVAAFTDGEIRALVETGQYSDPRAAEWVTGCLIRRRDKIADAWFSRVLPLDKFRVVEGSLAFEDLGGGRDVRNGGEYELSWESQDRNGGVSPIVGAAGRRIPEPRGDTQYLVATVKSAGRDANRIFVYLCPRQNSFEVVGIGR